MELSKTFDMKDFVMPISDPYPIGGSKPDPGCYVTNYSKLKTLSFFISI